MIMLRPGGKPKKVANNILKKKSGKLPPAKKLQKTVLTGPTLQH